MVKSDHKTKIIAYLELFGKATRQELSASLGLRKRWMSEILGEMTRQEMIWCVSAGKDVWYELPTMLVFV